MRTLRTKQRRTRGMTLIEIMVVITIIGMIASAVGVNVVRAMIDARVKQAQTDVTRITAAADAYMVTHGTERCPTVTLLLDEHILRDNGEVRDPWNHAFDIDCEEGEARALSAGPDGVFDTPDDI